MRNVICSRASRAADDAPAMRPAFARAGVGARLGAGAPPARRRVRDPVVARASRRPASSSRAVVVDHEPPLATPRRVPAGRDDDRSSPARLAPAPRRSSARRAERDPRAAPRTSDARAEITARGDAPLPDLRRTAVGAAALFFLLAGAHPDASAAREVTIELPDLPVLTPGDLPAMPTSPGELAKFVLTNPYAAVAVSVAAYLVVPRAAEALVKYLVVPAALLLVALFAAQNPDETVALVASAIRQARDHPGFVSGAVLAVLAVALSPYILVAALVGLLVSGVQLLPDALKPALPAPVREVEARVEQLQGAVSPGVTRARAMTTEARRRGESFRDEVKEAKRRADDARAERRREEASARAEEAARRAEEAEARRVADEARKAAIESRRRERLEALVAPVTTAIDAVEDAVEDATEVAAAVEEGARGTTRCVAEATPERRAECVDEQRERRKAREASRIEDAKRRGERLRKNAAERAGGART